MGHTMFTIGVAAVWQTKNVVYAGGHRYEDWTQSSNSKLKRLRDGGFKSKYYKTKTGEK